MASINSGAGGNISIRNIRLPYSDKDRAAKVWCVECQRGLVVNISPTKEEPRPTEKSGLGQFEVPMNSFVDGGGGLMLPSWVSLSSDLPTLILLYP